MESGSLLELERYEYHFSVMDGALCGQREMTTETERLLMLRDGNTRAYAIQNVTFGWMSYT